MSRSVSAPSSVTNTSPCWKGFIVPGSTLRYGSSFCIVTRNPRAVSSCPRLDAVSPLPSEEATPPVTNRYLVGRTCGAKASPVVRPAVSNPAGSPAADGEPPTTEPHGNTSAGSALLAAQPALCRVAGSAGGGGHRVRVSGGAVTPGPPCACSARASAVVIRPDGLS